MGGVVQLGFAMMSGKFLVSSLDIKGTQSAGESNLPFCPYDVHSWQGREGSYVRSQECLKKGLEFIVALLSAGCLQTVVALGQKTKQSDSLEIGQTMDQTATGFLYGFATSGQRDDFRSEVSIWLVTCKHVIQSAVNSGASEIMVRMNRSNRSEMITFRSELQDNGQLRWTLHPTKDVAVISALVPVLDSNDIQWMTFVAGLDAITKQEAEIVGLTEGDEVYILGFPTGWRSGRQDYPIVRHGVLAQIQGWLNGEHNTFLVDGSGFPGNSGGPVVTKPQAIAIEGTKRVEKSLLIGMVSDSRYSEISTNLPNFEETGYLEETADLIEVVPMESVDECITLAMQRES